MRKKREDKFYDLSKVGQSAEELHRDVHQPRHWAVKDIIFALLGIGITIALCVIAIIYREELMDTAYVAKYGLIGILLIAFIAASAFSATAIPLPYWVLTFTLPSVLAGTYGIWSPVWVGLFAATGATLGQLITFLIGYGGQGLSKRLSRRFSSDFYDRARKWIQRWGDWAVFIMSVTANPLHLPMTLAIASLRYPVYKFLLFGFLGQLIKSLVLAFAGYYSLTSLLNITGFTSVLLKIILFIAIIVFLIVVWQLLVWLLEIRDKNYKYRVALDFARKQGKHLLVIGGPWGVKPYRRWLNKPAHGSGDVVLDIDHRALAGQSGAILGSVTHLPFADKAFGAVFLSHVLEHLPDIDIAKQALEELNRVADAVFIVYPSRQSIGGWLTRDHHIWVWQNGNMTSLQQRGKTRRRGKIVVETRSDVL